MKHLKLDKHGEMAGGHNPQQVSQRCRYAAVVDAMNKVVQLAAAVVVLLGKVVRARCCGNCADRQPYLLAVHFNGPRPFLPPFFADRHVAGHAAAQPVLRPQDVGAVRRQERVSRRCNVRCFGELFVV